ncbi:MAG: hypothetical protein CM1200mP2_35370 [Planctomycetaceae bacterium]|nr:MAG: hypothetical protein CM1200mP2_35370 [Planctomycetaceae bacterium]
MTEVAESKAICLCGAIWDVSVRVLPNPMGGKCFEQCNSSHCFLRSGRTTECQLIDPSDLAYRSEPTFLDDAIGETRSQRVNSLVV